MESRKFKIIQLSVTTALLIACFCIEWFLGKEHGRGLIPNWGLLLIYLLPYIFISLDIWGEMIEDFKHKEIFNEEFLMIIATLGALAIGFIPKAKTMFAEAVLVMLLFQLGELLESVAINRSKKSITSLLEKRPKYGYLLVGNEVIKTELEKIQPGSILLIKPGETVPLDGIITEGNCNLNTMSITGESLPRYYKEGQEILSGCINLDSCIKIKTIKSFQDSTISKIIDLIKNANEKKSKTTRFISKFAKFYTPIVVLVAFIVALVGCLVTKQYANWITTALTCLIISCPCALVISIPLCYFVSIGLCAKRGILIKGANSLEQLAKIKTIVFDKTGTLTKSNFKVNEVMSLIDKDFMLSIAKSLESNSTHPIAKAIVEYTVDAKTIKATNVVELSGLGLKGDINNTTYYLGNEKLMNSLNIKYTKPKEIGSEVYIANKQEFIGYMVVADEIKEDSYKAIDMFKNQQIKTVMLSGDVNNVVKSVGNKLNIDLYYGQLLPQDKINKLEQLIKSKQKNDLIAFVGDGINDAPSIAEADIGIAMGTIGSSSAIEASDVVLMEDKLSKIPLAMSISKKANLISKENIVFALFIKLIVFILACFNLAPIWLAIISDVGVTLLAILNSLRCGRIKKPKFNKGKLRKRV